MTAADPLPMPARRSSKADAEPHDPDAARQPKNVHQRIIAVASGVGAIDRNSRNQYGHAAIGIEDVEEALSPVLSEHGVVTEWSYISLHHEPEWARGDESVYCAHLRFAIVNADDPKDRVEGEWIDVGGNPMAATSFARKGALKAIFHLAAAEDESAPAQTGSRPPAQRKTTRSVEIAGKACPECHDQLTAVYRDTGSVFVGHKVYVRDAATRCKWRPSNEHAHALLAEAPPDPDPPQGPHATPAGYDYPGILRLLPEEERRSIFTDPRFPRDSGEPLPDWLNRLSETQRTDLRLVLDAKAAAAPLPM